MMHDNCDLNFNKLDWIALGATLSILGLAVFGAATIAAKLIG